MTHTHPVCNDHRPQLHYLNSDWPLTSPSKGHPQKGHLNSWDLCIASAWPLNREKIHYERKCPESGFVVIVKKLIQHHYFSLQCRMIFQKSYEYTDLLLKKHSLLLSMLKSVVLLHIFVETDIFFMIILWIKSRKEQHLIKTEIICRKCLHCYVWSI